MFHFMQLSLILLPAWILTRAAATETADGQSDNDRTQNEKRSQGALRWNNLGVSFETCDGESSDDTSWLLHPSSGYVESGSLCGILGPSGELLYAIGRCLIHFLSSLNPSLISKGAGKTTFLNALGGTTPRNSGVHITGSVWYEELLQTDNPDETNQTYTRQHLSQQDGDIAMLSQHDNFFQMLTPRESLELAAYFEVLKQQKSNNPSAQDNHKEFAEKKLSLLGLSSVSDNQIGDRTRMGGNSGGRGWLPKANKMFSKVRRSGGLSGGERRRLSVALELITEPKIFLADEPTTGEGLKVARLVLDWLTNTNGMSFTK
jgi:ABC-type multidrug transport system ATPase subunit